MPTVVEGEVSIEGLRLAIIVSRFNSSITDRLLQGALEALVKLGAQEEQVVVYRVPGSFEIPQMARKVAESGTYDAIICLGAVLRGETFHFELISEQCARGIQQVAADFTIPVTFGVITADTVEQALQRSGQQSENKGWEAAMTAVEMATLFKKSQELMR
jgi:6,7-dimethyl-8-ribityllumazine synthase